LNVVAHFHEYNSKDGILENPLSLDDCLRYLIKKYIPTEEKKNEVSNIIQQHKIKYILGEIELNRSIEYEENDLQLIKDLYYRYC